MNSEQFKKQDNYELFAERYAHSRSAAARQLERRVLGHETGVNGYTAVEQADALALTLQLRSGARLLDIGAGRGWPGSRIAATSSVDLISTDVPVDGLRFALSQTPGPNAAYRRSAVAADGRALPLATESFDGVVHADVFC